MNIGTGSQVSVISDKIVCGENIETRPYFEGKYLVVGAALCGGRAYSMLKDFYSEVLGYVHNTDDDTVYDIMNKMIENAVSSELKVDTRFAGTRKNPDIKAKITNITTENFTPSALTLGMLEGMADELYSMYLEMNEKKSGIVGSGNGIRKNRALIDVMERRFGSALKIPAHTEEAAFGASLFALVSCGIFKNAAEAQKLIKYN